MITMISQHDMERLIREYDPLMTEDATTRYAQKYIETLDSRFDTALKEFAEKKIETDIREGEFSIRIIRQLKGCGYLQALLLLDDYIKDNRKGRIRILSR